MQIEVVGLPQPKGNKSAFVNKATGRAVVVEGGSTSGRKAVAAWQQAVCDAAMAYMHEVQQPPVSGPIAMRIAFRFPPIKSDPYRFWHSTKPDLDKLTRGVFDALKLGGAIADDSMVAKLTAVKRYVNESETIGCSIEIESLADEESQVRENRKQRAAMERRRPSVADNQERLLA